MPTERKSSSVLPVLAIACAVVALQGCSNESTPPAATATGNGLATIVAGGRDAPSEWVLDGLVEPLNQATLSAQTTGRVAEIHADVNDRVRQGQLLVRLRAAEQVAGLGQAQATLAAARSRDAQARAQFDRIRDMYERKVVARATYDDAVTARDAAAAQLAAAQAGLESAREGVSYTELRAPYDGTVTAKFVQPGEAVAPGRPLMTMAALGALRVVVDVPQSAATDLRALQHANVYVDQQRVAATKITWFPAAEAASSTIRARVDLPTDTAGLVSGTYVKVGFVTGEAHAMLVPRSAVVERSELRTVYVVGADNRVALRQVRLGRPVGDDVEVIAGLARGERVATDPAAAGLDLRTVTPRHD